jgi:hypothetical protein
MANRNYEKVKDVTSPDLLVLKSYAAGFLLAWVMVIVHCLGATTLTSIRTMSTFMMLAGIAGVIHNRAEEWGAKAKGPPQEFGELPAPAGERGTTG